jgi:hypothetical protein
MKVKDVTGELIGLGAIGTLVELELRRPPNRVVGHIGKTGQQDS